MDRTTPVEFEDNGSEFPPQGSLFTAASRTGFRARYANGIELICETGKSSGTKFEGTEGRLEISLGGRLATFPENLKDSVIGPNEIHLPKSNPARVENVRKDIDADHVRNFLDAVKSRQDPIEPVEIGHSTASLCILGNLAQILKRPAQPTVRPRRKRLDHGFRGPRHKEADVRGPTAVNAWHAGPGGRRRDTF